MDHTVMLTTIYGPLFTVGLLRVILCGMSNEDRLVKDTTKTQARKFNHVKFDEKRESAHLCNNG